MYYYCYCCGSKGIGRKIPRKGMGVGCGGRGPVARGGGLEDVLGFEDSF